VDLGLASRTNIAMIAALLGCGLFRRRRGVYWTTLCVDTMQYRVPTLTVTSRPCSYRQIHVKMTAQHARTTGAVTVLVMEKLIDLPRVIKHSIAVR